MIKTKKKLEWYLLLLKMIENKKQVLYLMIFQTLLMWISLVDSILYKIFIDNITNEKKMNISIIICLFIIIFFLIQTFSYRKKLNLGSKILFDFNVSLRNRIAKYLVLSSKQYKLKEFSIGEMKILLDDDIEKCQKVIENFWEYYLSLGFVFFASFVLIFTNHLLALISILLMLLVNFIVYHYEETFQKYATDHRNARQYFDEVFMQSMQNIEYIKTFNGCSLILNDQVLNLTKINSIFVKKMLYWSINKIIFALKEQIIVRISVYFFGGYLIIKGGLSVGGLVLFATNQEKIFSYLDKINNINLELLECIPTLNRIRGMNLDDAIVKKDGLSGNIIAKSLALRNVSFKYGQEKIILDQLSFKFKVGKVYALMGESGCGKSTIIKLISGLLDYSEGTIRINGKDLESYKDLFSIIGVVLQDTKFFDMTIRENIEMVYPDCSKEQFRYCCDLSCVSKMIKKFPEGYNQRIGENGKLLSSGEKQKIAIARMLLRDPPILILDESTSAIDMLSEAEILEGFKNIKQNKIIIIISHKKSIMQYSDEIITIKEGKIKKINIG